MTWFLFVVLMNMFVRKLPSCFGSWVLSEHVWDKAPLVFWVLGSLN